MSLHLSAEARLRRSVDPEIVLQAALHPVLHPVVYPIIDRLKEKVVKEAACTHGNNNIGDLTGCRLLVHRTSTASINTDAVLLDFVLAAWIASRDTWDLSH